MTVKPEFFAEQYHLHFFFNLDDLDKVNQIHQHVIQNMPDPVQVFPLLLRPAGPLPKPMFMLEFDQQYRQIVVDFFKIYQQQYSILIHPELKNELLAHTCYAMWLGQALNLRLEYLECG